MVSRDQQSRQQLVEISRQKAKLERLSIFLDEAFVVPVVGIKVGWDAIIGLLPVVGDAAGAVISSYFVYKGISFRLPIRTLLLMVLNIAIEFIVGLIPVVGDLLDVGWKANRRNYHLMEKYLEEKERELSVDCSNESTNNSLQIGGGNRVDEESASIRTETVGMVVAIVVAMLVVLLACLVLFYLGFVEFPNEVLGERISSLFNRLMENLP